MSAGLWCNGNTADSGPAFPGSSPGSPTAESFSLTETLFLFSVVYIQAHQQSLGGYAKSLANLKKKNLISVTPLSCALKDFIFALKLSAKALVDRLTK